MGDTPAGMSDAVSDWKGVTAMEIIVVATMLLVVVLLGVAVKLYDL